MKNKEFIIFDFDGTLINSIPDLTLAVNQMLSDLDLSHLTIAETTPFIGNGAKPLVERSLNAVMGASNVGSELISKAYEIYMKHYKAVGCKDTFLYDGVVDTLNYLLEKGYKMAICTNKPYEFVAPILDKLEIKHFFIDWIGEHSLNEKKPSAVPLQYLCAKHGMAIDATVMVGDSKNDILAAQNATMDSIGVSYGYNYNENIADYNPTVVANKFSELKKIL